MKNWAAFLSWVVKDYLARIMVGEMHSCKCIYISINCWLFNHIYILDEACVQFILTLSLINSSVSWLTARDSISPLVISCVHLASLNWVPTTLFLNSDLFLVCEDWSYRWEERRSRYEFWEGTWNSSSWFCYNISIGFPLLTILHLYTHSEFLW